MRENLRPFGPKKGAPDGAPFGKRFCFISTWARRECPAARRERRGARGARALVVYADAFDENFVPELAYVFGLVDAEVREFRDVHEPLFAGQAFDERAEFLYRAHDALVGLADLDFARDELDFRNSPLHAFFARGVDTDPARVVVVDVYLRARVFGYAADIFASRADEHARLFGVDLHDLYARAQGLSSLLGSAIASAIMPRIFMRTSWLR